MCAAALASISLNWSRDGGVIYPGVNSFPGALQVGLYTGQLLPSGLDSEL